MMTTLEIPSVLSSSQRRCRAFDALPARCCRHRTEHNRCQWRGRRPARQDIAETRDEIQRYHRLDIVTHHDGCYRIEGSALNQRLCLLHWLRRALRLCPHFVAQQFTPALKPRSNSTALPARFMTMRTFGRLSTFARASFSASLSPATYSFYSFICNIV